MSEGETQSSSYAQTVRAKLEIYNRAFPDIDFIYLSNGSDWIGSLMGLDLLIGYEPTCLDYEHPPELRQELVDVTVAKIQMMLLYHMASSYFFEVGQIAGTKRRYACIITLDTENAYDDDESATRNLMSLSDAEFQDVSQERYLDHQAILNFVIDHEAYHCLDSYYNSGIRRSEKELWGHYSCYNRERQADMFAIAMYRQRGGSRTGFVDGIEQLRAMSLLNGELNHDSSAGIRRIKQLSSSELQNIKPKTLMDMVRRQDQGLMPGYDAYLDYRVNAIEAIRRMGRQVSELDAMAPPVDRDINEDEVQRLIEKTRAAYESFIAGQKLEVPSEH